MVKFIVMYSDPKRHVWSESK